MKLHLCHLTLGLLLLLQLACQRENYTGYYNTYCKNTDTGVQVQITDYETGLPLVQQHFEVLYTSTASWLTPPVSLAPYYDWASDSVGQINERFVHSDFYGASYRLRHVTDSTYYATQWWGVPVGCDHQYQAVLKKVFDLPVTVRNESSGTILNFNLASQTLPALDPATEGVVASLTHEWRSDARVDLAPGEVLSLTTRALPDERLRLTWRFGRNGLPDVLSDSLFVSAQSSFQIVIR